MVRVMKAVHHPLIAIGAYNTSTTPLSKNLQYM